MIKKNKMFHEQISRVGFEILSKKILLMQLFNVEKKIIQLYNHIKYYVIITLPRKTCKSKTREYSLLKQKPQDVGTFVFCRIAAHWEESRVE